MTTPLRSNPDQIKGLFAVLVGVSVPSLIFGRTAIALTSGLAVISIFFLSDKGKHWSTVRIEAARPVGILVAITLLLWLPNVVLSSDPMRSFEAVARTGVFIVMGVFFWSIIQSDNRYADRARISFVIASAIAVFIAILSQTFIPQLYWVTHLHGWRSEPIATELKSFAALSVLTVPVLLATAKNRSRIWQGLGLFGAGGFMVMVLMTDNRAAIAGLLGAVAATTLAYIFRTTEKRRFVFPVLSLIALFGVIVLWLFFERAHLREIAPERNWLLPVWLIDFERQTIWAHTFEQAMTSPVFGLGVNTVNYTSGADAVIPGTDNLHVIPGHPHNWAMEVLAETGILGLSALIAAVVSLFYRMFVAFRETANLNHLAAIAVAAGYWVSGLFNFSFWSAWWQVSFVLALAICSSPPDAPRPTRTPPGNI